MRDLAYDERWRESLQRSRARRGRTRRLRRLIAKRPVLVLASPVGLLACAVLAAALPGAFGGSSTTSAQTAGRLGLAGPAGSTHEQVDYRSLGAAAPGGCEAVSTSAGYVNPLAGATLRPKRIDQGVDYKGSGTLSALGTAAVTAVATSETGWPGAFIEFQLLDGPAVGCFVFYAESIVPVAGLRVGDRLAPGQPVATIVPSDPSGIEIGWGAGVGTETYAAKLGEWSSRADEDSIPTAAGMSFSSLIASLGGPPGKVEG